MPVARTTLRAGEFDDSVAGNTEYAARRAWIAEYFDKTASRAWEQLTSDAPVSAIRQSVRKARDSMRAKLSSWLPQDLHGARVLDAGCGTGTLAIELAERGAEVVAVDLASSLIRLARERTPVHLRSQIEFHAGDMFDPALGTFDHVVAMDSTIHYRADEMFSVVNSFVARANTSVLFTVVPRTPLLAVMHTVGRAFPRASRAPAVQPVSKLELRRRLAHFNASGWHTTRIERVSGGFYQSEAVELRNKESAV